MSDPMEPTKQMIAGMLASLDDTKLEGIKLDDIKAAMSHPLAVEAIAKMLPLEASSAQVGDPAPDFTLPYLPGSGTDGATVTLSDHFGKRPVALIFGSYT
jgi:hypothetical protein